MGCRLCKHLTLVVLGKQQCSTTTYHQWAIPSCSSYSQLGTATCCAAVVAAAMQPSAADADLNIQLTPYYQEWCMSAVQVLAAGSIAGRNAVMQHVHSIVSAMQHTGWPESALQALGLHGRLEAAASLCLEVLLQSEGGLEAYFQQLQQAGGEQQLQQQLHNHIGIFLQLVGSSTEVAMNIRHRHRGQLRICYCNWEAYRKGYRQCSANLTHS